MSTTPALGPIHPGEILAEEYLTPLGITQHKLAVAIGTAERLLLLIKDARAVIAR